MSFNLSEWLMRRKIGAEVRNAGARVEHSRISNPYHAVSIETGSRACDEAKARDGRRYLSTAAPMLPLRGCTLATCQCRYVHHKDRRNAHDRRNNFVNPHAHAMNERRISGRRIND